jgi:hypothetical protein
MNTSVFMGHSKRREKAGVSQMPSDLEKAVKITGGLQSTREKSEQGGPFQQIFSTCGLAS